MAPNDEQAPRRVIVHMDCDAFYYSVECLRDPELIGKAVIVSGSGPRAVVTTASYEARKYGVGSAMPASKALRLCPHALVVPPHGELYREKSREVWELVRERLQAPLQHLSLDEAYADITELDKPLRVLRELVADVRERTGITISVGVGPNRLVAKVASDAEKPAGFVVLSREQACERFRDRPTRLLQGIGPRTAERLLELGIATVADLQRADAALLSERFGERMGVWLKRAAQFHGSTHVETSRVAKSRSSETTFDTDVDDFAALQETVRRLARDVCAGLQKRETRGRTIGIKVRYDDWTTLTRDRSLPSFTNDTDEVTRTALALLDDNRPARPVRLLGVRVAGFEGVVNGTPERPAQLALPLPL